MQMDFKARVIFGDNLPVLQSIPDATVNLIYVDPPFNTGKRQARTRLRTVRSENGDRKGFQGQRYSTTVLGSRAFHDQFENYLAFLEPRLREAHRGLS